MQPPRVIKGANQALIVQPTHKLIDHFNAFFRNINPAATWVTRAASQYNSLKALLEQDPFLRSNLAIECRTQGSYDRYTAIHSINDLDMLAFCTNLHYPPRQSLLAPSGPGWTRDRIFHALEAVIANDGRYQHALVRSNYQSMCVKLDLGIKVEILPVVPQADAFISTGEPFYLWRPSTGVWELGYGQMHQSKLSEKNADAYHSVLDNGLVVGIGTDGNFIPAVKVIKHLCSIHGVAAVSFHIECLLYSLPCEVFWGSPSSFIFQILAYISAQEPLAWYGQQLMTPCGDRDIFSAAEWELGSWLNFHAACKEWYEIALYAGTAYTSSQAVEGWQRLLGTGWFPSVPRQR